MGRRPLAVGETGKVWVREEPPGSGVHVARRRIRDSDGVRRPVQAQGSTPTVAKRNLTKAIAQRGVRTGEEIRSDMMFSDLATKVFSQIEKDVEAKLLSRGTYTNYQRCWRAYIKPEMGGLKLNEIDAYRCDDMLRNVRTNYSAGTARLVRATFNRLVSPADKGPHSAMPHGNPMSRADNIHEDRGTAKSIVTLASSEVPDLLKKLRNDPKAVDAELDYISLWMVCTGDRIGNALAADWSYLDLINGVADLKGVVVVAPGGTEVAFGSSKGKERSIDLPSQLVTSLQALWLKRECPSSGLVFPRPNGDPRPLSTVHHLMRTAFDRAGYGWLKPHGFRKTTASELSEAGLSDHEVAAYLGHGAVETTRKHYLRKRQTSSRRRAALDALVGSGDSTATVTELHGRSEGEVS